MFQINDCLANVAPSSLMCFLQWSQPVSTAIREETASSAYQYAPVGELLVYRLKAVAVNET